MYTKVQFSMADRINSAKTQTTDITNIDQAPKSVSTDTNVPSLNVDTQQIDNAGTDISQKRSDANTATNPSKINNATKAASDISYERPGDTTYPNEQDPTKTTPTPTKKGFTEKLLDAQMASRFKDNTNRPTDNAPIDYPKNQADNLNKPIPANSTLTRPTPNTFDPGIIGTRDPQQPSGDVLGNIPRATPGSTPGPAYSPPTQMKPPKFNMPKFK